MQWPRNRGQPQCSTCYRPPHPSPTTALEAYGDIAGEYPAGCQHPSSTPDPPGQTGPQGCSKDRVDANQQAPPNSKAAGRCLCSTPSSGGPCKTSQPQAWPTSTQVMMVSLHLATNSRFAHYIGGCAGKPHVTSRPKGSMGGIAR